MRAASSLALRRKLFDMNRHWTRLVCRLRGHQGMRPPYGLLLHGCGRCALLVST